MIDDWWLMTDYRLSSHGKCGWNGGPQADGGECESSEFKRNLNGGPQADGGGEQVSINDDWLLIIRTSFILSGAHQATQVSDYWWCSHGKHGRVRMSAGGRGWWTAIIKNWTAIKRKKYISTDDTEGHGRWLLMTDDWLLIVFTRKMGRTRIIPESGRADL